MPQSVSDETCKVLIKRIAKKYNIDPKLIVTKLMSEEDKHDMRHGDLPYDALECHVKVWIENGMPNYREGINEDSPNLSQ